MKYYLLLLLAVIIGQSFWASATVWYHQNQNENLNFFKALIVYFKKEVGSYVVVLLLTILIMFVLSDYMDLNVSRADLIAKGSLSKWENAQKMFRTYASEYGVFAQLVASLFYKGGVQAIMKYGKSHGIEVNNP